MSTGALGEGARYALANVPALALVAVACLAVRPGTRPRTAAAVLLFASGLALARWLPDGLPPQPVAASVLLGAGAAVATGWRARTTGPWLLPLICGLAAGLAAGLPTALAGELAGSVGALALLAAAGWLLRPGALPVPSHALALAARMGGAWLAAMGVLLLALWWRAAG